jgi:hypothetical protein
MIMWPFDAIMNTVNYNTFTEPLSRSLRQKRIMRTAEPAIVLVRFERSCGICCATASAL